MDRLSAVMRYGMMRNETPTSEEIREQFFASVLAAVIDDEPTQLLSRCLHQAYVQALVTEQDPEGDGEGVPLVPAREAEAVLFKAGMRAYGDDDFYLAMEEILPTSDGMFWSPKLMKQTGHLLGHYQRAHDAEVFKLARSMQAERRTTEAP